MAHLNFNIRDRLEGIRAALMAHHLGGVSMPNAVKGVERETFIRDFLEKVFPTSFRFSSGAITDTTGALSGQVDIAIENPVLPSFPMPGASKDRLMMAESVSLVIEVKSNIQAQWNQIESTAKSLKILQRNLKSSPVKDKFWSAIDTPKPSHIPLIAIGYTGFSNIDVLKRKFESTALACRPDAVLVIESGVFISEQISTSNELGLFALCAEITKALSQSIVSPSDLYGYLHDASTNGPLER
jgi:hypothetical protein